MYSCRLRGVEDIVVMKRGSFVCTVVCVCVRSQEWWGGGVYAYRMRRDAVGGKETRARTYTQIRATTGSMCGRETVREGLVNAERQSVLLVTVGKGLAEVHPYYTAHARHTIIIIKQRYRGSEQRTHNPTTVYAHNGCTTTVLYCRHSALVIIGRCEQKRQTLTCGTLTSACETLQWFPNLHPVHTPIYCIIIHLYAMTCECRDQTDTTTTHKVFCILCVRAICHNTSFPILEKQYLHCVYL